MAGIKLRLALWKDEEFLRKTRNDNRRFFLNTGFISKSKHHKWFADRFHSEAMYVISFRNRRIGTISLLIDENVAILGRFVIKADFRGKGLGHKVVDEFKHICKGMGIRRVRLEVKKENFKAVGFYVGEGFHVKKIGRKKIKMETLI